MSHNPLWFYFKWGWNASYEKMEYMVSILHMCSTTWLSQNICLVSRNVSKFPTMSHANSQGCFLNVHQVLLWCMFRWFQTQTYLLYNFLSLFNMVLNCPNGNKNLLLFPITHFHKHQVSYIQTLPCLWLISIKIKYTSFENPFM